MPVYFDIETLDLFDAPHLAHLTRKAQIKEMRFGLAVTHDSTTGEWRTWWPADVAGLWEYLAAADSVVGWNIIDFDIPVVQANVRKAGRSIKRTETVTPIDLFAIIRAKTNRWYKLDVVTQENLPGMSKSADGIQAVRWLTAGDPESLRLAEEYCRQDVQILVDLWAKAQADGLILPARAERKESGTLLLRVSEGQTEIVADTPVTKPGKTKEKPKWWQVGCATIFLVVSGLFLCNIIFNMLQ